MVQAAIEEHLHRLDVSADRVLSKLAKLAFANVATLVDTGFRYADKIKSLELLGRHLQLFTERTEQPTPPSKLDAQEWEQATQQATGKVRLSIPKCDATVQHPCQRRGPSVTPLEQCAWQYIGIASQVLRVIEQKRDDLTPSERRDLEVATRSAKRVLAVRRTRLHRR